MIGISGASLTAGANLPRMDRTVSQTLAHQIANDR